MPLGQVANEAYEEGLARHHPWLVRKAVSIGFNAVTSRENFMKSICKE